MAPPLVEQNFPKKLARHFTNREKKKRIKFYMHTFLKIISYKKLRKQVIKFRLLMDKVIIPQFSLRATPAVF